jgi:hypothetical protein
MVCSGCCRDLGRDLLLGLGLDDAFAAKHLTNIMNEGYRLQVQMLSLQALGCGQSGQKFSELWAHVLRHT